jgi:HAD superfamily hydrolase (TIGR01509 family)
MFVVRRESSRWLPAPPCPSGELNVARPGLSSPGSDIRSLNGCARSLGAPGPDEKIHGVSVTHRDQPAFLFDLDGTLVDSVYQHVIAWRDALESVGINLPVWKIHRRIGMSGGLFVNALARELDTELDREVIAALPGLHADAFIRRFDSVRPLPGAAELLATLSAQNVRWAIATSGPERYARLSLELLGLPEDTPLITRDQVRYAKPDPDLFLAAAERVGAEIGDSVVVGDSVWDLLAARRARALGIGLLSGGYGREELIYSGAYRVYDDPRDLLNHLDEVGVRRPP